MGYNTTQDTLFRLEVSDPVVAQVLVGTGHCVGNRTYDYQPTYCFDEFPTFENGGAVTEMVQIDPDQISPDTPIMIDDQLVTDPLIAAQAGIEIPNELAQLRLTFTLNPHLFWEDGEPVTSADAAEMFRVLKDPELRAPSTDNIDRLVTVDTPDRHTVVQTYVPGYFDRDYFTTFVGLLPAHRYMGKRIADIRDQEGSHPFSYGPYMVKEHIPGTQTTLVSNPYFVEQPKIGTIVYKYLADADQLVTQLSKRTIDYAGSIGVTPAHIPQFEALQAAGVATIQSVPGPNWEHLDFGITRGDGQESFFADIRVRQAVAYAINRRQIIDAVLGGRTTWMNTYVPAEHPSYPGDYALEAYAFNPSRACQLLAAAGWIDCDGDGLREKDGCPFKVSFYTTEGNPEREAAAVIIRQNLKDVGIDVELQLVPPPELFKQGHEGILYGRRFELAMFTWVTGVEPPHQDYMSTHCPGPANDWKGFNLSCYTNHAFDVAAERALSEVNRERKQELDREPLIIFNRDLPAFPLFQHIRLVAFNPAVTGVQLDPTSTIELYNIQDIDIDR